MKHPIKETFVIKTLCHEQTLHSNVSFKLIIIKLNVYDYGAIE